MAAGTFEVNPGPGGTGKFLTDSLTTVDGAAAPASAVAQLIKLIFGDAGDGRMVSEAYPLPTSHVPPPFLRVGFAEVGSGLVGKAADELTLIQTGAGMAVNQSGGNLVITTGTTTNSETVIRSVAKFRGSLLARVKTILSQRIANNTFRFELADLIGEALAFTINSAASVTVTFPTTNPFTSANVGQFLRLSVIAGAAGIPGRFAIASVAGLDVTFTVAAWPASGSGTLTLYGHNWIANEYSGTTATSSLFDAQRRGWASGNTTATVNTTASPGHVTQLAFDVHTAGLSDALVASNTGYQWTQRASRIENIPDEDVDLYLFIVIQNGSTAPASTTTLTVSFIQAEDQGRQKVRIASSDPVGSHALPVYQTGGIATATQPISGSVTATLGAAAVRAGFIAGSGIWYDDSSTALGASASFTGTSRDATVTATAATFANAATYAEEVRVSAESDVAGELWLEVSRDNTNWRRVKSAPTAAVTGGGHAAEIIHKPSWRYWRVGYTNGAGAQARFAIGSLAMAV